MNRTQIFLLVMMGFSFAASGQKLYMEKTFGGARFETDSLSLSTRDVLELMQDNPAAFGEFKRARLNSNVAGVLGFSGGLLVAVPLVTALIGGKPEWTLAAAGGALIIISIPFTRSFNRHAENAVETYNMKYQTRNRTEFQFTGNGGRLVIRF